METLSDSEVQMLPNDAELSRRRWKQITFVAIGVALGMAAIATTNLARGPSTTSVTDVMELDQIEVVPPREKCSKVTENCASTKCCQITGFSCFETKPGVGKCMKKCVPGIQGSCKQANGLVAGTKEASRSVTSLSATNLFCFSVYLEDTGSTKKSYALDLLRTNLFLGSSIFGCEAYRVYSDVATWISPDQVNTVQVFDPTGNDFHFEKRKHMGTWVNAGIFIQVWKAIQKEGIWKSKDYTVKADPETVFLPMRLRAKLENQKVTDNGIYFENCPYVAYGFFGALEVISQTAVSKYLDNLDDCKSSLNWKGHEKLYGNQAWGEDLFAQKCMDMHGVDKIEGYDLMVDGNCEAHRPESEKKNKKWKPDCASTQTPALHRFAKSQEYFDCLKATQR
jgi:hypothetical protein